MGRRTRDEERRLTDIERLLFGLGMVYSRMTHAQTMLSLGNYERASEMMIEALGRMPTLQREASVLSHYPYSTSKEKAA